MTPYQTKNHCCNKVWWRGSPRASKGSPWGWRIKCHSLHKQNYNRVWKYLIAKVLVCFCRMISVKLSIKKRWINCFKNHAMPLPNNLPIRLLYSRELSEELAKYLANGDHDDVYTDFLLIVISIISFEVINSLSKSE